MPKELERSHNSSPQDASAREFGTRMPDVLSNVGQVSLDANLIHWKIPDFFGLPHSKNTWIRSPNFDFNDNKCELGVWPNGFDLPLPQGQNFSSAGWFGLIFINCSQCNPEMFVQAGILGDRETEVCSSYLRWNTDFGWFMDAKFIRRTEMELRKDEFAPDGNLTILFAVSAEKENDPKKDIEEKSKDETAEETGKTETIEEKTTCSCKRIEKLVKDATGRDLKSLEKLRKHYKELYCGSQDSDLTIKVRGREFRCHKAILRARSPVFDAAFSHEMKESTSGTLSVEDCDPEVFEDFLIFVYCGRVDGITADNASGLYYAADKYDFPELKEECLQFLKNSVSVDTFCDIVCLATAHGEGELLQLAISFFGRNLVDILEDVKWQQFVAENPTKANELYLKAVRYSKTAT